MREGMPQVAKLPRAFRKIRLELAREKGHPAGSSGYGYTLVAPLGSDRKIDADLVEIAPRRVSRGALSADGR